MDPDTFRSGIGADVYWRRRVVALIGVLVVVAVVAWACSSSKPERPRKEGAADRPAGPDAVSAALPTVTVTSSPGTPSPPSPSPSPYASPSSSAAADGRPGGSCSPADLVLSVRGTGEIYGPGDRPRFLLTLVNTGEASCRADVGPRAMEVRITSGADRVWSSADCVSGGTDDFHRLERGVPYVREVVWDRRRSDTECAAAGAVARPGTYVAAVGTPGLRGDRTVFHLR
ncbi:hypothetical protein ACFYSC_14550 [Streptosporangium sp. NPDC004379]|uniref:hypothetical protein n=1 Tax=Streptosporangium sp. NPDC004379 TaxID=3366189 RepID=UPI0036C611DF